MRLDESDLNTSSYLGLSSFTCCYMFALLTIQIKGFSLTCQLCSKIESLRNHSVTRLSNEESFLLMLTLMKTNAYRRWANINWFWHWVCVDSGARGIGHDFWAFGWLVDLTDSPKCSHLHILSNTSRPFGHCLPCFSIPFPTHMLSNNDRLKVTLAYTHCKLLSQ
jgi:hypothetical protein